MALRRWRRTVELLLILVIGRREIVPRLLRLPSLLLEWRRGRLEEVLSVAVCIVVVEIPHGRWWALGWQGPVGTVARAVPVAAGREGWACVRLGLLVSEARAWVAGAVHGWVRAGAPAPVHWGWGYPGPWASASSASSLDYGAVVVSEVTVGYVPDVV